MAGVAGLSESAFVRVAVAIGAELELDAFIARLAVRSIGVAILAADVAVPAGEREARGGVIEGLCVEAGGFPVSGGVTARAIFSEAALMLVFMAGDAGSGKTHPCAVEIFTGQQGACRGRDVRRGVAGAAGELSMMTIQLEAGFGVIESLGCGSPVDHLKVCSVVIGVAFDAGRALFTGAWKGGVEALVLLQLGGNLAVAVQAAELG